MWKVENGLLYHYRANHILPDLDSWQMVLPKEHHAAALAEAHDQPQAVHLGVNKTYHRLATHFYWLGFYHHVAQYVKVCDICQRCKVEQAKPVGETGHRVIEEPWLMVGANIMDPYTPSSAQHHYVLVGTPKFFFTDNGTEFCNKVVDHICQEYVIKRVKTPLYHPQANPVERINRVLKPMMISFVNGTSILTTSALRSTLRITRL